ncbi:MAG TPA: hypothetical protein VJX94_16730 [Stellaceae bacterium]|nr:hypothetical protein [Stellaceae bacterium]
MEGLRNVMQNVSAHISYNFSKFLEDEEILIRWLVNPDFSGSFASGVLVAMGPNNWGTKSADSGDGGQAFHLKADSESGRTRTAFR